MRRKQILRAYHQFCEPWSGSRTVEACEPGMLTWGSYTLDDTFPGTTNAILKFQGSHCLDEEQIIHSSVYDHQYYNQLAYKPTEILQITLQENQFRLL